MCNHYLTYQLEKVASGDIGVRWFEDCRCVVESFDQVTGPGRAVSDLLPQDFQQFRHRLARRGIGGRKGFSAYALNRAITVVKAMFKYAYEMDLIDGAVKYGRSLDRPAAAVVRRNRQAAEQENGKRLFEAEQILAMLRSAPLALRAMILLGINGGYGNKDCASLPITAVDFEQKLIDFGRAKTGVERVVPLWPETVSAMQAALASRPKPAAEDWRKLFFLTVWVST